jgi:hypothetical protein
MDSYYKFLFGQDLQDFQDIFFQAFRMKALFRRKPGIPIASCDK